MPDFLRLLFDTSDFTPRWTCGNWTTLHGWTHIAADVATWGAYMAIPVVLTYLLLRRRDLPFHRVFWLFAAFIFTCGTVHLIESMIFWYPLYRLSAVVKVATAVASWATVFAIIHVAPRVLALPGLAKINEELIHEVAERRRAETLHRESQEQLRFILQATGVGTWDWDVPTGRVRWSETMRNIHGLPPDASEGTFQTFLEAVHPEDRDIVERTICSALQENSDFTVEYRVRCHEGKLCWLEMKAHIVSHEGKAQRIAGVCTDVTVRKQAEEKFRLTVEASPNVVLLVDQNGRIVLVNSRVASMFGYEPQELVGHTVEMLVPERFRAKHPGYRAQFNRNPQARPMGAGRDLYALRKDGSEFPVEIGLSPTESEEGLLVLATIVDITSRKHAESERAQLLEAERAARNEAERANRLKDMFLATVSHELRTPLNAILGWSQLLSRSDLQGEAVQATEIIQRNAKVQARLIEDLLDMSRIISGKIRLDMHSGVELPLVVNSAIEAVQPAAEVKGIRIERHIDPVAGPVRGDPNRLQQIVWNLLTNAIKFTPKGGKVSVTLRRADSQVEVMVQDTGIGIKPEFLPFMFDRFRQADSSTSRQHAGLGLGLSIVKNLVELHGGTVRASSEGENKGATFVAALPVAGLLQESSAEPQDPLEIKPVTSMPAASCDPQAFNGLKVMVVDDDPDACILAQRVLEDCGATVVGAGSADEALGILENICPDLILSDISMPGKDGYQFIQEVRQREASGGPFIPAAALTALTRPEDRARAMMSGYQAHLSKPLTAAELIGIVGNLTGRTRQRAQRRSGDHPTESGHGGCASAVGKEAKVLLVEDNADLAEMLKVFLEDQGYRVHIAPSIAAAVVQFEAQAFDVVISDIGLPDGSGIHLMRQLRARRPVNGIALSGHQSSTLANLCRQAGFAEYLVKPAEEPELLAAIQRVLAAPADQP